MTQPRAYYEGRREELILASRLPWPSSGIKAKALAIRYDAFKDWQKSHEHGSKVFQATLEQDKANGIVDASIPILVHKEAGRASAYAFICELLRDYVDGFKDDDLKWSNGLTEHQLKVLVARVEQDINRCQLLLLGEEP